MEPTTGLIILGSAIGSKKLVEKILGPTAEYLGEGLKDFTEKSMNNVKRIFINAKEKLGDRIDQPGAVPAKVLKGILQEGPFCEDEIAAEYFGGLLASSKSGIQRDDRGVALIALLSRLTTYQIRSHFIFYQIVKQLFNGEKLFTNKPEDRIVMRAFIPMQEYLESMESSEHEDFSQIIGHVMHGLSREQLIEESFRTGDPDYLSGDWKDVSQSGIIFIPSLLGAELFLWAYGYGNVHTFHFLDPRYHFPIKGNISIPKNAIGTEKKEHPQPK